jgi:hypothetical protein
VGVQDQGIDKDPVLVWISVLYVQCCHVAITNFAAIGRARSEVKTTDVEIAGSHSKSKKKRLAL